MKRTGFEGAASVLVLKSALWIKGISTGAEATAGGLLLLGHNIVTMNQLGSLHSKSSHTDNAKAKVMYCVSYADTLLDAHCRCFRVFNILHKFGRFSPSQQWFL